MNTCRPLHVVCVCTVLLLFPIRPASAQDAPSCEAQTNESTGETTVTCDNQSVDVLKQPDADVLHAVAALSHTGKESNALSLVTGSMSSQFTRIDTARALIDSDRHNFKASYTNGRTKAGIAIEQVVVVVPAEQTTAIREADNFWIRLGAAVFDLAPVIDQMEHIYGMRSGSKPSP